MRRERKEKEEKENMKKTRYSLLRLAFLIFSLLFNVSPCGNFSS